MAYQQVYNGQADQDWVFALGRWYCNGMMQSTATPEVMAFYRKTGAQRIAVCYAWNDQLARVERSVYAVSANPFISWPTPQPQQLSLMITPQQSRFLVPVNQPEPPVAVARISAGDAMLAGATGAGLVILGLAWLGSKGTKS